MRIRSVMAFSTVCALLVAIGIVSVPSASATGGGYLAPGFRYTGAVQTWAVPTGVKSISFEITGGAGGLNDDGSTPNPPIVSSTTVTGTLAIPDGVTALDITVGGQGETLQMGSQGGWPNGGDGGAASSSAFSPGSNGAGGGGSSDIRASGAAFPDAYVIVGGSGGTGGLAGSTIGGLGGMGGLNIAQQGSAGQGGSDGGSGGAPAATGVGAPGGSGETSPNSNSGAGGGGGGGYRSGAGGGAASADYVSFYSGGGGGGGAGNGMINPQYVTQVVEQAQNNTAYVELMYLIVTTSTIPALNVGSLAHWDYDAGADSTYSIVSGALPPGLTLNGDSGEVQGVPIETGTYSFVVAATNDMGGATNLTTNTSTTVTVNGGGPASLAATSATAIGATNATLNGSVSAGGSVVTGLSCNYSTTNPNGGAISGTSIAATPASVSPNATGAATAVACSATGLASDQTYYYQISGTQSGNTVRSGTASFKTGSSPASVTTNSATSVTTTTATGSGTVSATQAVNPIVCKVATSPSGVASGTSFNASPLFTAGTVSNQPISCNMTGLTPDQVYYYAFFATDASGTSMSPKIESFITRLSPPWLGTVSSSDVTQTSAVVSGSVTPTNERVTSVYCRYIAGTGNPKRGTAVAATPFRISAVPTAHAVSCELTGLAPGTSYSVRMEATDKDGTASAPNIASFTTSGSEVVPGAPGRPTAVAGAGSASVSVVPPTSGGVPSSYEVTSTPGAKTCTVTVPSSSCVVAGLSNGTSYTFTATASNSAGTSSVSLPSDPVTPRKMSNTPVKPPKYAKRSKIKHPGTSTLLARHVRLASGAFATPRVRFLPVANGLLDAGDARRLGTYSVKKNGRVIAHVLTSQPVKIVLTLRFPATAEYRAYRAVKTWTLK